MRNLEQRLKNRVINNNQLIIYGFKKQKEKYIYITNICENQFEIIVEVINNNMTSKLIDLGNEEEYILVDIEDSVGKFVGNVRKEYEEKLDDIVKKCTYKEMFKNKQSKEIIQYIKEKYKDELEFLWEKFDDCAIWRNKQNNKWYGLIVKISEKKLGIDSDRIVEIIDLRYQKEETQNIVDNKKVFQGYHMNKKSWITIKLDNTMNTKKIKELIDNSYNLSINEKKNKKT